MRESLQRSEPLDNRGCHSKGEVVLNATRYDGYPDWYFSKMQKRALLTKL